MGVKLLVPTIIPSNLPQDDGHDIQDICEKPF